MIMFNIFKNEKYKFYKKFTFKYLLNILSTLKNCNIVINIFTIITELNTIL